MSGQPQRRFVKWAAPRVAAPVAVLFAIVGYVMVLSATATGSTKNHGRPLEESM
jgi:hypothetical protein